MKKIDKTLKPEFKNKPNPHVIYNYNSGTGVKVHHDIWLSRAPAVVGIIFAFGCKGGNRVLVIKRSKNMREEPLKLGAPSGYLDWDETGFEGMTREVFEETSMYLPDYKSFLVFDNDEQPFYVQSDPAKDKNQNISLSYVMIYDFMYHQERFPEEIEKYTDHETAEVLWMRLSDFYGSYNDWAFNHDERIKIALKHYNKNNGK